eukprot:TRINITY_DN8768_c0_g1_i1.p1 TRINITY_DN8768_c0_g1~~TRINITY_DN8768_c0_g1_i1.p1  ORF type:complete len:505 (+),score=121.69 TRINITY_DN8768_c0_g1_i1:67-1581(+)
MAAVVPEAPGSTTGGQEVQAGSGKEAALEAEEDLPGDDEEVQAGSGKEAALEAEEDLPGDDEEDLLLRIPLELELPSDTSLQALREAVSAKLLEASVKPLRNPAELALGLNGHFCSDPTVQPLRHLVPGSVVSLVEDADEAQVVARLGLCLNAAQLRLLQDLPGNLSGGLPGGLSAVRALQQGVQTAKKTLDEAAVREKKQRLYKTQPCANFATGRCSFGAKCHFAHGDHELRIPGAPLAEGGGSVAAKVTDSPGSNWESNNTWSDANWSSRSWRDQDWNDWEEHKDWKSGTGWSDWSESSWRDSWSDDSRWSKELERDNESWISGDKWWSQDWRQNGDWDDRDEAEKDEDGKEKENGSRGLVLRQAEPVSAGESDRGWRGQAERERDRSRRGTDEVDWSRRGLERRDLGRRGPEETNRSRRGEREVDRRSRGRGDGRDGSDRQKGFADVRDTRGVSRERHRVQSSRRHDRTSASPPRRWPDGGHEARRRSRSPRQRSRGRGRH